MQRLVNRCPNLIELDLSDSSILTSETIKIVSKLKRLEYLSLSRCYNINVAAYLYVLGRVVFYYKIDVFVFMKIDVFFFLGQLMS